MGGIEYFIHAKFPFLDVPRSFEIQEIRHVLSNYKNINITSSILSYSAEKEELVLSSRVYHNSKGKEFYILKVSGTDKIFFK